MEHPEWLRNETVFVRAEWDGRDADVGGLTERVSAQLTDLSMITGPGDEWALVEGAAVSLAKASIREVIEQHLARDDDGAEWPERGYEFSLSRQGSNAFALVRYRIGAARRGRRLPSNGVFVAVSGPELGGVRMALGRTLIESVMAGCVRAWDPESAGAYDDAALDALDGVGRFAPVIGQRTWVSSRLGEVRQSTSAVAYEPGDGGTYLRADDSLRSVDAAREVRATLKLNGICTVPGSETGRGR